MADSVLTVTTDEGTLTFELGNEDSIVIDSPNGPPGTPGAEIRTPHVFAGFPQNGSGPSVGGWENPPATNRTNLCVTDMSYAGGVVTVTQMGADIWLRPIGTDPETWSWPDGPSFTTEVIVDDDSSLVIDGLGVGPRGTTSLKGLSAISFEKGI